MPDVVGLDHLVLSVRDLARPEDFYGEVLSFLGFKLKYGHADTVGWSNRKTVFWIAPADLQGRGKTSRHSASFSSSTTWP
jgi:catechol 2,3-dioxygenase-like lactoylglutathione lyase family enzyme